MSRNNLEKLRDLRDLMAQNHVDAYLVPRCDEYLGEFVAPYAERLSWLTGFTGSAGTAIIMADRAVVMSDGRYTIQLKDQVDLGLYDIADSFDVPPKDWLVNYLKEGQKVAYDPKLYSIDQIAALSDALAEQGIQCTPLDVNLNDQIWDDQPQPPNAPAFAFSAELAGYTAEEKIKLICEDITNAGADAALVTKPDSVGWLLNTRGSDLEFMPVALSTALVDARQQHVYWMIDTQKVGDVNLPNGVEVVAPSVFDTLMSRLDSVKNCALDGGMTPQIYETAIQNAGKNVLYTPDPCAARKSHKTVNESDAIFDAHIVDGAAIVRTLAWLDGINPTRDQFSELDVVAKLDEFRKLNRAYKGESFPAITGFAGNGAIVHYRASEETNAPLNKEGLLLMDTGAQYYDEDQHCAGTTDITRTVWVGDKTQIDPRIKTHFTRVLQGHINLAMSGFAEGTIGKDIDAVARGPLNADGLDYAHGTGHGVGCFGDVHEPASSISKRGLKPLEEGMLISNEPGYYEEGSHGIRIESLVFVVRGDDDLLGFQTVTVAPIQMDLVDLDLMDDHQIRWLNDYHAWVYAELSPLLDDQTRTWLEKATAPVKNGHEIDNKGLTPEIV